MNIRTRLLFLVLFAVLVPAIFVGLRVVQDRNSDIAEATRYVGLIARNVASDLDEKIRGTAQLLYGITSASALQARETALCSEYLMTVRDTYPQYVSIVASEADGAVSCSSLGIERSMNLSDSNYFKKVMAGAEGPILEPLFGRVSNRPVLMVGFPVRHLDNSLRFLIVAGLDLAKFAQLDLAEKSVVPGMEILLVENNGNVLVWDTRDANKKVGSNISDSPLFKFAVDNLAGAVAEIRWNGQDDHVWAVAPVSSPRDPGLRILVGVPKASLTAPFNRRLAADLTILAVVAVSLVVLASLFAEFTLRRPIGSTVRMATRLAGGDLNARIPGPLPRGEIGDLMSALNDAANSIQKHREQISDLDGRLRQAQKMEAIGQLTGGIAHDFNNLLTVIVGNSELLKEHLEHDPAGLDLAEITESAALRGSDLTRSLLAFARRQSLMPQVTDVNELLTNMIGLLRRSLGEHIECRLALDPTVWLAMIDRTQLTTAILNLAVNARDAMPQGGRLILETAKVKFDGVYAERQQEVRPGDYVMIAVTDTGTGMSPEILAQVFDPFFTTKNVGKGSGLGLSMVYGFVKQSAGHINIYSEDGHGTTVKLYLPRSDETGREIMGSDMDKAPQGGTERILVVEDDELVRGYVQSQLARFGYRVHAVINGVEALAVLRSDEEIDLLFTDIVMPGGISGVDLAEQARILRPGLKILFTSGYTESVVHDDARFGTKVHLLNKPYRRQDLAEKLRLALSGE